MCLCVCFGMSMVLKGIGPSQIPECLVSRCTCTEMSKHAILCMHTQEQEGQLAQPVDEEAAEGVPSPTGLSQEDRGATEVYTTPGSRGCPVGKRGWGSGAAPPRGGGTVWCILSSPLQEPQHGLQRADGDKEDGQDAEEEEDEEEERDEDRLWQ